MDAEVFKWQAAEMLLESGVEILLHTMACAPTLENGYVAGVFTESKNGRQAIKAKVTIDATADADLAFQAGCVCDNETHDVTLGITIYGIEREKASAFAMESPNEHQAVVEKATKLNGRSNARRKAPSKGCGRSRRRRFNSSGDTAQKRVL